MLLGKTSFEVILPCAAMPYVVLALYQVMLLYNPYNDNGH